MNNGFERMYKLIVMGRIEALAPHFAGIIKDKC
jgi:hypothetical protein